jgi:DNA helicase HerA-like ATPase
MTTDTSTEAVERLAKDCDLARKVLSDLGTFETGQAIMQDASAALRALAAERDAALARAERADLPLTDAQLMADSRVKALVDVLEWALRYQPKDDSCESWVSDARLALAAIPAQGGET